MNIFDIPKRVEGPKRNSKLLEITISISAVLGLLSTTVPKPYLNYILWVYSAVVVVVFTVPFLSGLLKSRLLKSRLKRATKNLLPKIDRALGNLNGLISGNKVYCFTDVIGSEQNSHHFRAQVELLSSQFKQLSSVKSYVVVEDEIKYRHEYVMDSCKVINGFIREMKNTRTEIRSKNDWYEFDNRIQSELATLRSLFLEWAEEARVPPLADHYKIDHLI